MKLLTNMLFLISTSLLIPVIIFLLIAFIFALLMLGNFYGLYINRLKFKKSIKIFLDKCRKANIKNIAFEKYLKGNKLFAEYLQKIKNLKWHPVHSEKIVSDFEMKLEKELESSKTLMRIGPMLGLMGTLIPMGPALVGLASGDISSMALNMQVAFSTTVVGIFIGIIGYVTQLIKQRWFIEDVNNLEYLYNLSQAEELKK